MAKYVDNKALYAEVCRWKAECREKGELVKQYDTIGIAILNIAHGLSNYFKFARYTPDWKEEMIADGIEASVKGLINFDETNYTNPHAYITMMCFNSFIGRIKKEKKEQAKKYNYFVSNVYDSVDSDLVEIANEDFIQDIYDKLEKFENSGKQKTKSSEFEDKPKGLKGLEFLMDDNYEEQITIPRPIPKSRADIA